MTKTTTTLPIQDFKQYAPKTCELIEKHSEMNPYYKNSDPLIQKLVKLQSKSKGAVFEHLLKESVSKIFPNLKLVDKPGNSIQYDLFLEDGRKVEVKGGTMAKNNGKINFLQIRPQDEYDEIWFVMVMPDGLKFAKASKELMANFAKETKAALKEKARLGKRQVRSGLTLKVQHSGQRGSGDNFILGGINPHKLPAWMKELS